MKKCRITVLKTAFNEELAREFAHPQLGPCNMHRAGQVYYTNGWQKPEGLCDNAWKSMMEYTMTLAHGGSNFYKDWMLDAHTAVVCCNDGIRPVSFKIEVTDEDAEVFETRP